MRSRLTVWLLTDKSTLGNEYLFVSGELIIGSVEIVLVFFDVGSKIDFQSVYATIYFCSLTTTVWSFSTTTISVSPRPISFLFIGRFLTKTLIFGVLLYNIWIYELYSIDSKFINLDNQIRTKLRKSIIIVVLLKKLLKSSRRWDNKNISYKRIKKYTIIQGSLSTREIADIEEVGQYCNDERVKNSYTHLVFDLFKN